MWTCHLSGVGSVLEVSESFLVTCFKAFRQAVGRRTMAGGIITWNCAVVLSLAQDTQPSQSEGAWPGFLHVGGWRCRRHFLKQGLFFCFLCGFFLSWVMLDFLIFLIF